MRVLMLVSEAPPIKSGIARVTDKLTEGLRRRGITVDTISANEIPRWAFKEFRFSSLGLRWPEIQARIKDYDIVHVHGSVPTFSDIGLLFGKLGNRKGPAIVYTHHCDIDIAGIDLPVRMYNAVHRRLIGLADHVVASTPTYALQLEDSTRPGRTSAVAFGVQADQFQSYKAKQDPFNVLFVGQLRPYKGVDVLLKAWQQVDNAVLNIVGDGHEHDNLKALAAELGLTSVNFHGSVTDKQLTDLYSEAHTLVLPSKCKAEAFGLVLLEGMAAGCVPIASDLPGVSDVVSTSGYTFPVGDSDALAALLCGLRDDPAKRQKMSVLASARALACNWDYTAEAYEGIYRQVYLGRLLERSLQHRANIEGAVQKWLTEVAQEADAERASLMLLAPNGRDLHIAASVGLGADVVASTRVPVGHRMAGFVAHTGRPMLVRRKGMHAIARLYKSNPSLTSALLLPLHCDGHIVGVLNLARGADKFSFTLADQEWLQRLAQQIAPIVSRRCRFMPEMRAIATGTETWVPHLASNALAHDVEVQ